MGRINMNVDAASLNDVVRRLDKLDVLPQYAQQAMQKGAEIVLEAAKARAPVRTGQLQKALKVGRRAKTLNSYAVEVGAFHGDAPHAHLVEYGHGGPKPAPAHPFLEPAAESVSDEVADLIMAELLKGLD